MNDNTTLAQFIKNCKAVRFEQRIQHTGRFSHTRSCGCNYYVYVCPVTFAVFNPFTKKHDGRDYKSFFSSISAEHAKEQAYNYIIEQKSSTLTQNYYQLNEVRRINKIV